MKMAKITKNEVVLDAILKDGEFYCGKCGEPLGRKDKYSEVVYQGEKYTQFIKFCTGKGCKAKSHYELRLSLNKREMFIFPFNECKKVKKDPVKYKEEEI